MSYSEYWSYFGSGLIQQFGEHIVVVLLATLLGSVLGVGVGVFAHKRPRLSAVAIKASGVLLTIPSLALYVLLISVIGLGWPPVLVALTLYSLLPIVQNTIVGLNGVDSSVVEAASAMGMNSRQSLVKVEFPMAWPIILTGIRVAALLLVSTAAIGAIVRGPGLGRAIYDGLNTIGSPTALYQAVSGIVGVAIVGLILNLTFIFLGKLTTSRGLS
ncbi:ABC transporter permease [Aeromicrobium sp. A1-2]|uniref:ABC transporter permease n=1 Tax=Aeromicrobium sp. A1-2 TaxID=2107713 RepID=UPI001C1FDE5E|nr:ABC transporter permease [Aeromicrobium sp. A1-2]